MRSRLSNRGVRRLLPLAMFVALAAGCDGGGVSRPSPTAPGVPTLPPPTPDAAWIGTWTFVEAAPAGDCLVDALNAFYRGGVNGSPLYLTIRIDGDRIELEFSYTAGDKPNEGFWPLRYTGAIESDGSIRAEIVASLVGGLRVDPWLELCYGEWSMQGGELRAQLAPDRRGITGETFESFRVEMGGGQRTFTVRSQFRAQT